MRHERCEYEMCYERGHAPLAMMTVVPRADAPFARAMRVCALCADWLCVGAMGPTHVLDDTTARDARREE